MVGEGEGQTRTQADGPPACPQSRFGKLRAKVEHVFRVVKCQFGYRVRYRGIAKNGAQVFSLLALANLYLAHRTLASA
jgi:transposase, IS5 family